LGRVNASCDFVAPIDEQSGPPAWITLRDTETYKCPTALMVTGFVSPLRRRTRLIPQLSWGIER